MANVLVPKFGELSLLGGSQLSLDGGGGGYSTEELGWEAAPSAGTPSGTAQPWYSTTNWGNVITTGINATGSVLTSILGQREVVTADPYGYGGGAPRALGPMGSTFGSIDSKILLVAAVAVVAILAFSGKKSA